MRSEVNDRTETTKQDYYYRYYIPNDQYVGTFTFSSSQNISGTEFNYAVYVRLICFEDKDQLDDSGTIPLGSYTTLFSGWIRTNNNDDKTTIPINYVVDSKNKSTFYLIISNVNGYAITFKSHLFYYFRIYTATGNYIPDEHFGICSFTVIAKQITATGNAVFDIIPKSGEWFDLFDGQVTLNTGAARTISLNHLKSGALIKPFYNASYNNGDNINFPNLSVVDDKTTLNAETIGYATSLRFFYPDSLRFTYTSFLANEFLSIKLSLKLRSNVVPESVKISTSAGDITFTEVITVY